MLHLIKKACQFFSGFLSNQHLNKLMYYISFKVLIIPNLNIFKSISTKIYAKQQIFDKLNFYKKMVTSEKILPKDDLRVKKAGFNIAEEVFECQSAIQRIYKMEVQNIYNNNLDLTFNVEICTVHLCVHYLTLVPRDFFLFDMREVKIGQKPWERGFLVLVRSA